MIVVKNILSRIWLLFVMILSYYIFKVHNKVKIYGKKYEKIDCHINLPKPVFIYTYLGKDYQVVRNTKISFKKLNSLFWDYLPEFYDIKRFSVIFDLIEMEVSFSKDFLDDFNIIEVQRYSLKDNKRLIDELLQL